MDKKLTKFEIARVIGTRATQISMGAEPCIDISKLTDPNPISIAKEELKQHKLPMKIIRPYSDGEKIEISLYY